MWRCLHSQQKKKYIKTGASQRYSFIPCKLKQFYLLSHSCCPCDIFFQIFTDKKKKNEAWLIFRLGALQAPAWLEDILWGKTKSKPDGKQINGLPTTTHFQMYHFSVLLCVHHIYRYDLLTFLAVLYIH